MDWSEPPAWLAFGLLGNAAFASRFLIQWIASERAGRSVVPAAFWYLSIGGSVILLVYAIHRRDPIFTLAYLPNAFIYFRNIALVRRETRAADDSDDQDGSGSGVSGPLGGSSGDPT